MESEAPMQTKTALDYAGRAGGLAVPPALAALAVLHAAWALGSNWPADNQRELAERVLADETKMPPVWATWAVALGLGGAAGVVRRAAAGRPSTLVRRLTQGIAAVFLVRGAVFVPIDLVRGRRGVYERLDLAIYSPLSLALGAGAAAVAKRAAPISEVSQANAGECAV
jgi:hypothetical protein